MRILLLILGFLCAGCSLKPKPLAEYEYEFTLEINGKQVQRITGKAREVRPKE